jgi:hypothetical protein
VHSSVQTKASTAMHPISHCILLTVRRIDECVIQRIPARACAHVMLLCVLHAGMQVRGWSLLVQRLLASTAAARPHASSAAFVSEESRTDRMAVAGRIRVASIDTHELSPLRARPFLARSDRMRH